MDQLLLLHLGSLSCVAEQRGLWHICSTQHTSRVFLLHLEMVWGVLTPGVSRMVPDASVLKPRTLPPSRTHPSTTGLLSCLLKLLPGSLCLMSQSRGPDKLLQPTQVPWLQHNIHWGTSPTVQPQGLDTEGVARPAVGWLDKSSTRERENAEFFNISEGEVPQGVLRPPAAGEPVAPDSSAATAGVRSRRRWGPASGVGQAGIQAAALPQAPSCPARPRRRRIRSNRVRSPRAAPAGSSGDAPAALFRAAAAARSPARATSPGLSSGCGRRSALSSRGTLTREDGSEETRREPPALSTAADGTRGRPLPLPRPSAPLWVRPTGGAALRPPRSCRGARGRCGGLTALGTSGQAAPAAAATGNGGRKRCGLLVGDRALRDTGPPVCRRDGAPREVCCLPPEAPWWCGSTGAGHLPSDPVFMDWLPSGVDPVLQQSGILLLVRGLRPPKLSNLGTPSLGKGMAMCGGKAEFPWRGQPSPGVVKTSLLSPGHLSPEGVL